jgi:hypothetical protein
MVHFSISSSESWTQTNYQSVDITKPNQSRSKEYSNNIKDKGNHMACLQPLLIRSK